MKSTQSYRTQLEAAYILLAQDVTSLEKFEKIKSLLQGINPELDKKLTQTTLAINHLKAVANIDVIHFATHSLSEATPQEKKRKKAFIVFIASWKTLKSEVGRVQGYYNQSSSTSSGAASVIKTTLFAKGPFGLITIAAVAIVGVGLLLTKATTTVEIKNLGCPPIEIPAKLPFPIPGLHLPEGPIASNNSAPAKLPALTLTVRSSGSVISATVFGQTGSYTLPSRTKDIIFDGDSLLNKTTELKLGSAPDHALTLLCN